MLAGEYVLGVLDAHEADEVAAALAVNAELRRAVAFWERQLHPLSSLAISAEPPPETLAVDVLLQHRQPDSLCTLRASPPIEGAVDACAESLAALCGREQE